MLSEAAIQSKVSSRHHLKVEVSEIDARSKIQREGERQNVGKTQKQIKKNATN